MQHFLIDISYTVLFQVFLTPYFLCYRCLLQHISLNTFHICFIATGYTFYTHFQRAKFLQLFSASIFRRLTQENATAYINNILTV